MDLEKITAHALTHLLKHQSVHVNDLHQSIQDAHNLRDEEMPMVHDHLQQLFVGWVGRGWLAGPGGYGPGLGGPLGQSIGPVVQLNNQGREEALQFLEAHGYPPP
ncbi:MAG: hypothetical protein ACP5QO_04270 [Clostridia bacterium]